jgi:hypothetical protein
MAAYEAAIAGGEKFDRGNDLLSFAAPTEQNVA